MMSEVLQANIFFFITSVAVIIVTILVGVALFYVVSILRNVRDISDKIKRGSDVLTQDLSEFRATVKAEGVKAKNIFNFFAERFRSKRKRAAPKKKESKDGEGVV